MVAWKSNKESGFSFREIMASFRLISPQIAHSSKIRNSGTESSKTVRNSGTKVSNALRNSGTKVSSTGLASRSPHPESKDSVVTILGYYDKYNLGDEAYTLAIPVILHNSLIDLPVEFRNPDTDTINPNTELIICGGGDIINDWFNQDLKRLIKQVRCPVYALSIGITYESTINESYLGHFDKIYLRHPTYLHQVSGVVGSKNVFYAPDAAFIIPRVPDLDVVDKSVGVFLATGMDSYIQALSETLKNLKRQGYHITFYAFNTSPEQHESDQEYFEKYYTGIGSRGPIIRNIESMLKVIGSLELAICFRYHSHIFSIIQHTPFVSIAATPKVQFLVGSQGWDRSNGTPTFTENVAYQPSEIGKAVNWALKHTNELKKKIALVHTELYGLVSSLRLTHKKRDLEDINSRALTMVERGLPLEHITSNVMHAITNTVSSPYTFGFLESLTASTHPIIDMIKWVFEDHKKKRSRGIRFLVPPSSFSGVHRSGWEYVMSSLASLATKDGILLDPYVDSTFLWNETQNKANGIIPFRHYWIGFIHHTPFGYDQHNLLELFRTPSFLVSLKLCKGLIVLSEYIKRYISKVLDTIGFGRIKVYFISHPTEFIETNFDFDAFAKDAKLTQIGGWLRDPYAIYQVQTWMKKFVLIGPKMESTKETLLKLSDGSRPCKCGADKHYRSQHTSRKPLKCACNCGAPQINTINRMCQPCCSGVCIQYILEYIWCIWDCGAPSSVLIGCVCDGCQELTPINKILKKNHKLVQIIEELSNPDYDDLLSSSVVFLKLEDASAVNTIIECIVRNTPVVVNRLPAVQEYLGEHYPLYYDRLEEVTKFDLRDIERAHRYLVSMNKMRLTSDHFIRGMKKILEDCFK